LSKKLDILSIPSLHEQVEKLGGYSGYWPGSISQNEYYFNAGILNTKDGLILARRLTKVNSGSLTKGWRQNESKIELFHLTEETFNLKSILLIDRNLSPDLVNLEDPRMVLTEDGFEVWCAKWEVENNKTIIRQCALSFDQKINYKGMSFPLLGGNDGSSYEKNWGPFYNGQYIVYSLAPYHLVIDRFSGTQWKTKGLVISSAEIMHGGTPPIDIGDRYLSFCQSSTNAPQYKIAGEEVGGRCYKVWAYTFQKHPPFSVIAYTPSPLLIGSLNNPFSQGSPAVIFPGGLIHLSHEKIILVAGVNDCQTAWVVLEKTKILSKMLSFANK
jgi:predicted GH43/DUF377 family glycosyl hydrolase